jgi:F-type H+-transporting ATPase subunit alpha
VPVSDITRWAKEFVEFMDAKYPQVEKELSTKRELTAEIKTALNKAITDFNQVFQPTK